MKKRSAFTAIFAGLLALGLALASCDNIFNEKGPGQDNNDGTKKKQNYTVFFDANGGSGTAPAAQTVKAGSSITLPGRNGLTMSGHTFGGWFDYNNYDATYKAGSLFKPTDDTFLYARWEYIPITYYYITFDDVNGGSIYSNWPEEHEAGSIITLPDLSSSAMSGFMFDGWNTNADGTGVAYQSGDSYTLTGNITLYAMWKPKPGTEASPIPLIENIWADGEILNPSYSANESDLSVWHSFDVVSGITYYVWWNGGIAGNETKSFYGYVSALYSDGTEIFAEGAGWETPQEFTADRNGTVLIKVYMPDSYYYYDNSGTFGVVYNTTGARPTYTVTYDYYDQIVQAGSSITLPDQDSWNKIGHILNSWYDSEGNNYSAGSSFTPTGDITLYAKWDYYPEPIPLTESIWINGRITYTDTVVWYSFDVEIGTTYYVWWNFSSYFYGNGTKSFNGSVSALYSDGTNIFTEESGWREPRYFTADKDGTVLIMVYANSSSSGTFGVVYSTNIARPILISFDANNSYSGTGPVDRTIINDSSIILPDEGSLARSNFTFGGWNTNAYGTGTTYQSGDSFIAGYDTILYAIWVPNPGTADILLGIEQIIDGAPIIENIKISRTNKDYPATYPVFIKTSDYDADSIKWEIAGVGIYTGQTITGSSKFYPFPLTADTWVDGSLTERDTGWYSFNVTKGTTYYLWWNDYFYGDKTKSMYVYVSASYSGGPSIFSSAINGWATPKSFTADRTGTVRITVNPNQSSTYHFISGTFALAYSADSTRPSAGGGAYDSFFILDAEDLRYNSLGGHTLVLTVTKDGRRYQRTIPFEIVP